MNPPNASFTLNYRDDSATERTSLTNYIQQAYMLHKIATLFIRDVKHFTSVQHSSVDDVQLQ